MQVPSSAVASVRAEHAATQTYSGDNIGAKPTLSSESTVEQTSHASGGSQRAGAVGVEWDQSAIQQDQLFAEFHPLVRRLIRQYGGNTDFRNDLEGEIYYRFCVLLKAFDPSRGVPLRPYLVRQLSASVYSFARNHWRRQHREVSLEMFAFEREPTQSVNPTADWDDALDIQQIQHTLPAALAKLSERQRNVVMWRYYEHSTFEEIGFRLGIQTATARSLLRHALTHLRTYMAARVRHI